MNFKKEIRCMKSGKSKKSESIQPTIKATVTASTKVAKAVTRTAITSAQARMLSIADR